jgi:hypothetical protein
VAPSTATSLASTRLALWDRRVEPGGDAPTDQTVAVAPARLDLRIERPSLAAGFRIERDDAIRAGCEEERVVHDDGRGLETAARPITAAL